MLACGRRGWPRAAISIALWQLSSAQPYDVLPGTQDRRCFDVRPGTADRTSVTLRIPGRNWLSIWLSHAIVEILLREYLGYTVEHLDVQTTDSQVYEDLTNGHYDFDMEQWSVDAGSERYRKYVLTEATVEAPDLLVGAGYWGRTGIYTTPSALAKSELADYYRFYQFGNRAALKANNYVMFGEDDLHEFLRSEGLEPFCAPEYENCNPGPTQGYWIPPVCQLNPTECAVVLMQTPGYDRTYFEQLTFNYNLSLIHAWAGLNVGQHVKALMARGKEVLFYTWEPDPTPQSVGGAVRIAYPDHSYGCAATWLYAPDGPIACDYPERPLLKVFAATFRQKAPEAYVVLSNMVLYMDQVKAMSGRTEPAGGPLTPYEAACEWLKANPDIVTTWAPDCIVSPKAEPQDGDLVFDPVSLSCREVTVLPQEPFTYTCDYGTLEPVGTANRQATQLKVVRRGWLSQQFVASITELLLRDFLGYSVVEVDGAQQETLSAGDDMEKGAYDMEPESWQAGGTSDLYLTYVVERGSVLNPGTIGYEGRSGTYILPATNGKSPWATWWRFYHNEVGMADANLNFLRFGYDDPDVPTLVEWLPQATDGNSSAPACTATWCSTGQFEGFWVPPQCEADPTRCFLHIHAVSSYDEGHFEALTKSLGNPFIHAYYGVDVDAFIQALHANRTYDVLFYYYEPDPFIVGLGAVRMSYPKFTFGCDSRYDGTPDGPVTCDYQERLLQKLVTLDSRQRAPESYFMFSRLQVFRNDINAMIAQHTGAGGPLMDAHDVGCWWIRENLARVQETIAPDCVSKPKAPGTEQLGDFIFDPVELFCVEVACQPDEVLDTTKGIACRRCGEGQLPNAGFSECVPCAVGTSPNRTKGTCDRCPKGSYCPYGTELPEACPYGSFADEAGFTECARCGLGTYQPHAGQSGCESCPSPMTTPGEGSRNAMECLCPVDFFKPLAGTDTEACRSCPEGLECAQGSDVANAPCVDGQLDEESVATAGPHPVPRAHFYSECSAPLSVFKCISDTACPGGHVETCKEGFEGVACGRCYDGWFRAGTMCVQCQDVEKTTILFPILPLVMAPGAIVLFYYISRDPVAKWNSPANHLASSLLILLIYIQTLAAISACYMRPPVFMRDSTDWVEYTTNLLSLLRPSCALFSDFTVGSIGRLLLPIYTAVLFVAVYLVSVVLALVHRMARLDGEILWNCYCSLFNTFFIGISRQTFQLFQCYDHPNGERSLRSQPDVLCYSPKWNDSAAMSVAAVAVFCGGFIALCIWIILAAPRRFHEHGFQKRWKFIFIKFRPSVWWWGLVLLIKGVWLNLPTVVFDHGSSQIFWLVWALVTYLMCSVTLFPWRGYLVGILDVIMHSFLAGFIGFLPHFVDPDPDEDELAEIGRAYTVFCLAPFGFAFVTMAIYVLQRYRLMHDVSPDEWRESAREVCHTFQQMHDAEKLGHTLSLLPWYDVMRLQHTARLIQTEIFFDTKPRPLVNAWTASMLSGIRLKATESEEEDLMLHRSAGSGSPTGSASLGLWSNPLGQGSQQMQARQQLPLIGHDASLCKVDSREQDVGLTPRRAAEDVKRLRQEVASFEGLLQAVTVFLKRVPGAGLQDAEPPDVRDVPREKVAPDVPPSHKRRASADPVPRSRPRMLPGTPSNPPFSPPVSASPSGRVSPRIPPPKGRRQG